MFRATVHFALATVADFAQGLADGLAPVVRATTPQHTREAERAVSLGFSWASTLPGEARNFRHG